MSYINNEILFRLVPRAYACEPCTVVCEGTSPQDNLIPCQQHDDCATGEEDWESEMDLYRYWKP